MPLAQTPPKPRISFVETKIVPVIKRIFNDSNIFVWLTIFFSLIAIFVPFFRIILIISFLSILIERWKLYTKIIWK